MESLIPTESHVLGGGAVEIHCFGARYGNWSLAGKTPEDAEKNNPGIIERMERLARLYGIETVWAPNPSAFNGKIVSQGSADWIPWRDSLRRGPLADGVRLGPGTAFAVSSGDCPTLVLRDSKNGRVVAAHAGRDSVIKRHHDLVSNALDALRPDLDRRGLRGFIACGIDYEHFTHPWDDPQHGDANRKLHALAAEYDGAAFKDDPEGKIHLPLLITGQLISHGVSDTRIGFDGTDTYGDRDVIGYPLWHSHRRDKDGKRNLVLVIRRT